MKLWYGGEVLMKNILVLWLGHLRIVLEKCRPLCISITVNVVGLLGYVSGHWLVGWVELESSAGREMGDPFHKRTQNVGHSSHMDNVIPSS